MTSALELRNEIVTDADPLMRRVGRLLLNLDFEPIAHRENFPNLGEIDLAFKLQRDGFVFVFIVEVSGQSSERNEKISYFFSRWSDPRNLNLFFGRVGLTNVKNTRIYVDMSRKSNADISPIRQHLENQQFPNHVLFADDVIYFEKMFGMIGKWARSDLLSFVQVPRSATSLRIPAIQFYLEEYPAFCFVADVRTLLESCYISRRLGDEKGYQRALNEKRVKALKQEVNDHRIVAFPNSILLNCEDLLKDPPVSRDECPKPVEIYLPTSHCSCLVVDGQHRLLGLSGLEETDLSRRQLPVIAYQRLPRDREVRLFVDINSKQKRIDSNLIQDLKADFTWDPDANPKEHSEKIMVLIARRLNKAGPLRGTIYFGTARETKGNKITLSTFVSVIKENQLIGGKKHFWQISPNSTDLAEPEKAITSVFSTIRTSFTHKQVTFALSNTGLRMLFRAIQILERNRQAEKCKVSRKVFLKNVRNILSDNMISDLSTLYGIGGKVEGTKRIIKGLKKRYPKSYANLELDFRRLVVKKHKQNTEET
jgi:DGQHR domain-containing protein